LFDAIANISLRLDEVQGNMSFTEVPSIESPRVNFIEVPSAESPRAHERGDARPSSAGPRSGNGTLRRSSSPERPLQKQTPKIVGKKKSSYESAVDKNTPGLSTRQMVAAVDPKHPMTRKGSSQTKHTASKESTVASSSPDLSRRHMLGTVDSKDSLTRKGPSQPKQTISNEAAVASSSPELSMRQVFGVVDSKAPVTRKLSPQRRKTSSHESAVASSSSELSVRQMSESRDSQDSMTGQSARQQQQQPQLNSQKTDMPDKHHEPYQGLLERVKGRGVETIPTTDIGTSSRNRTRTESPFRQLEWAVIGSKPVAAPLHPTSPQTLGAEMLVQRAFGAYVQPKAA